MNVNNEEHVYLEMALTASPDETLPLEGKYGLSWPPRPATPELSERTDELDAVVPRPELLQEVVAPPSAPSETQEVRLRAKALSELHLMIHLPINKFCDVCREGKLCYNI
eukprot:6376360-Heterocapsa_arctica.AAC.1